MLFQDVLFSGLSLKPFLRSFELVLASKHPQSSLRRARIGPVLRTEECASDNQSSYLHPLLVTTQLVDAVVWFQSKICEYLSVRSVSFLTNYWWYLYNKIIYCKENEFLSKEKVNFDWVLARKSKRKEIMLTTSLNFRAKIFGWILKKILHLSLSNQ